MARAPKGKGAKRQTRTLSLALQGGGSHGAFSWGALDRLFEDPRLRIEAISGTSAGAMNAVVAAHGAHDGGAEGARAALEAFWRAVSEAGRASPVQRSALARLTGDWSLDDSPSYVLSTMMQRVASPYDYNLFDVNPLRDLVAEHVDFEKVRGCADIGLFLGATNVETGRVRVFEREEITLDAVMASACLPLLYKAVEIDGQHYWDGGFMGNPPLFPLFYKGEATDIVIIQINPVVRPGVPKSASAIQNRLSEITFNSALLHELRAVDFVTRLIESGRLDTNGYRRMNMHMIEARKRMRPLGASSKMNSEWAFLRHLFEIGRSAAGRWLDRHFDDIGQRSTLDLRQMFTGRGAPLD